MESDTPRTDAESPNLWVVPAEFAKQLERELAAMRQQRDEARRMYCEEAFCHRFNERGGEATIIDSRQIAHSMGWDCFKEGGGA